MSNQFAKLIERLRVETAGYNDGQPDSDANITLSDAHMLLACIDELKSENLKLRQQAQRGREMCDAASSFLKAYGEKYRNFASGGMRPTAILLNEVKVMWAVHTEIRALTEKEA